MGRPLDVIFIAGSWPPRRRSCAVQNARLLASLNWHGHLFVRRATEIAVDNSCPAPVLPGMQEHRLWSRSLTPIHRVMHRVGLDTDRMPDDALPWALRTSLSSVCVGHSDLLVTISHPLSTHIAGLITKRFRRKLPWLTYFSDPWSDWGDLEFPSIRPAARALTAGWNARWFNAAMGSRFLRRNWPRTFVKSTRSWQKSLWVSFRSRSIRHFIRHEHGSTGLTNC